MMGRNALILSLVTLGGLSLTFSLTYYGPPWGGIGAGLLAWIVAGVYGYLTRRRRGYRE